jgi:hypothetical protein
MTRRGQILYFNIGGALVGGVPPRMRQFKLLVRQHGTLKHTFYRRKAEYGGLGVPVCYLPGLVPT